MERLSPLDLMTLWPDKVGQWQDMGAIAVVGPRPDSLAFDGAWADGLRAHVASRLDRAPRLRQTLRVPPPGLGRPLWVNAQRFDVRDHVRVLQLPAPGTEQQVLDAVEHLRRQPLDPALPLWQVWLLTGLDDGARCALCLRVHHALADGPSAVTMLASLLFDTTPQRPTDDAPPPWRPGSEPSSRELLADNVTRCATSLSKVMNGARHPQRLAARGRHAVATIREMSTDREPRSSLLAPIGAERRFAIVRTELASLASAAHSQGGTVNDALLAVIAGGLRALLTGRGEPVDAVELRAIVPVALARAEGDESGNRLGQIVVRLPIGMPDTWARLALIASRTKNLKPMARARHPVVLRGAILQRAAMWFAARQRVCSIYLANLPGPRTPLHLLDAPVQDLCPVVPLLHNLTIGVGAMSYAGSLSILTVADRDTCPDLGAFVAGMNDALAVIG